MPDNKHSLKGVYDGVFFCAYFANVFMLLSVSLLFHYAEFVKSLGGDEWHLGWIVGIGAVGAIAFRFVQGQAIDRFGPVLIWILSLIGLIASNLLHVNITELNGWAIYGTRLMMNLCVAGVFGSWLSFVSLRVPTDRVAEVIGVVGSSGFLGMAFGPAIGDWIFQTERSLDQQVDMMFYVSSALLTGSLIATSIGGLLEYRQHKNEGTLRHGTVRNSKGPSFWKLLTKYHPGFLLVVAGVMGLSISLPGTFLRPFLANQDINEIRNFFFVYNFVAFVSRVSFRRAPQVLGIRNSILLGLACMATSMLLYVQVDSQLTMIFPAIAGGLAHSFLFPAVVAGGTAFFPKENRGVATSLILAMYDAGVLIGSPLVGLSLRTSREIGLPAYPVMFCVVSLLIALTGMVLWLRFQRGDGTAVSRRKK